MCMLWVRTYWRVDFCFVPGVAFNSEPGRICIYRDDEAEVSWSIEHYPTKVWTDTWSTRTRGFSLLGFRWYSMTLHHFWDIDIPCWAIVTALLAPPVLWIRSWRVRFHQSPNGCHRCGYDLRATPERCPECGAVPETIP